MYIRHIVADDFHKGFLSLLSQLNNHSAECSYEEFKIQLSRIVNQGAIILVVESRSRIIATGKILIEWKHYQSVGHIQDVVVDIAHRGEQLGSALLDSLIDYARDKQCYKIVLEAKEEIMPFYQKNGFSKSGASLSLYF